MTIRKVADIAIKASPNGRSTVSGNGIKFYSYDKNSAAIDFHIQNQDGAPTDLFNVDVKLMLLTKESDEWKKFTAFDGVEIISEMNGHARYVIPDKLRGYQGVVQGYIYLDFTDDSRTDECYFEFTIERSLIEEEFENGGEYYIKDIQTIFDEVKNALNSKIPEMQTEYDDLVKTFTNYANEKIAEYDSRFVTLNSNLLTLQDSLTTAKTKVTQLEQSITTANTNLNTRIDEISKKIDDNDVFTKQESSANVVNQIIGKENVTFTVTLDLKNKVAKSIVENQNSAYTFYGSTALMMPGTGFEVSQTAYDQISTLDSSSFSLTRTAVNEPAQMLIKWNILEIAKKSLGEKYFKINGATDKASQIELLRAKLSEISGSCIGFGSGPGGNKLNLSSWRKIDNSWQYRAPHTNAVDAKISNNIGASSIFAYIDDDGFYHNLVYAETCDGVTPSKISVNYVSAQFKLNISVNEQIELTIANNHVENLATPEEAKAGTDTTKTMTPATTAQSIDNRAVTLASNQTIGGIKNFKDGLMFNNVSVATLTDIKEYRTSATATVPSSLTSSISSIKYTLLRVGNRVKFWATINVATATGLDAVPEILTIPAGYKIDAALATAQTQIKLDVGQLLVNTVVNNYTATIISSSAIRFGTTREGNHYVSGEWLTADAVPV